MSTFDFLADDCVGGQTLLRLVSRGNAILAELLRMSQNIPNIFKQAALASLQEKQNNTSKIQYIVFDFHYLQNPDIREERIEANTRLMELDDEFREEYIDILKRFYLLFESILKFVNDYNKYIEEVEDGIFIQLTMDLILLNPDGKQLMAEALYLYGVMLILLDELIIGPVRERLLVSFYRYKGQTEYPLFDSVCELVKSTGYLPKIKKPERYPEELFKRVPINEGVIKMIVGRLRSDDIYNMVSNYPDPEHRGTALATQGCMLYIILYFAPDILQNEFAAMREIVDKHFPDNWIISYYLGYVVDLSTQWGAYPAAREALKNTLQMQSIVGIANKHKAAIGTLQKTLDQLLTEGVLTKDFVLEKNARLMSICRQCNVVIRWILLHAQTTNKQMQESIFSQFEKEPLLLFLLKTAQFEYELKTIYTELLDTKEEKWAQCKGESSERMKELGDYFSGEIALVKVKKNDSLKKWFHSIGERVGALDFSDSTLAGRKIQQIMQALEEVQQFHQIETNEVVKQFLAETSVYLTQMIRIVNIKDEYLGTLSTASDMSYAWQLIRSFISSMQLHIQRKPRSVIMLRSTFLKLSSILEFPLVRINQAKSPDLISVSEFYSTELVKFVRRVLSIVPSRMFQLLDKIIQLQTNDLKELPTKVEKEHVQDYAQHEVRAALAKATHDISVFTEGMLAMERTLVGVIEIDPKQLLEDGIRKELVTKIAGIMDSVLVIKTPQDLIPRLRLLAAQLDGFKRSFQYIQDYISVYGLKIWQEEFSRIVNFNVEQECNMFLKKEIQPVSKYQSATIKIPTFPPTDNESVNFIGRLLRELIRQTDYRTTTYLDQMSGWFDERGKEVVGIRTFSLLIESVGVFGVTGLDNLLCFTIVKKLQAFVLRIRANLKSLKKPFSVIASGLHPSTIIPQNSDTLYKAATAKTMKLFDSFLGDICTIGQLQLLRRQIASLLNFTAKIDSKVLYQTLEIVNEALLKDIQAHYMNPDSYPYPDDDENKLLSEMSKFLETVGINDPVTKIYITTSPLDHFPLLMFLFLLTQGPKFHFDTKLSILTPTIPRKKGGVDGIPFVVGLITLLKQFHSIHTQKFLAYVGQYIRSYVNITDKIPKLVDLPHEARNMMTVLEVICKYSTSFNRKDLEGYLPQYLLDCFTR